MICQTPLQKGIYIGWVQRNSLPTGKDKIRSSFRLVNLMVIHGEFCNSESRREGDLT